MLTGLQKELLNSSSTIYLYADNQSAIHLASNDSYHPKTKHIDIRLHYIRQVINEGELDLKYLSTQKMVADIMTKPMVSNQCKLFSRIMGISKLSLSGDVEYKP